MSTIFNRFFTALRSVQNDRKGLLFRASAARREISFLILTLSLISCETYFDVEIPEEPSKLYAFCVPGAEDTTAIIIGVMKYAMSSETYDLTKAEIDFRVNGVSQEISYNKGYAVKNLPGDCFYTPCKINPQDKVTIDVSLDGLEDISSEAVIPDYPVNPQFIIDLVDNSVNKSRFTLKYEDESDETYYAVLFREKEYHYEEWWYEDMPGVIEKSEYTDWYEMYSSSEYDTFQSFPELYRNSMNNQAGLMFWRNSDVPQEGGIRSITFNMYIKKDVIYSERSYIDYSYEARLYKITKDLFDYYFSELVSANNYLTDFGLAQNYGTFTNIRNGFGILGGMAGVPMMCDPDIPAEEDRYLPEV